MRFTLAKQQRHSPPLGPHASSRLGSSTDPPSREGNDLGFPWGKNGLGMPSPYDSRWRFNDGTGFPSRDCAGLASIVPVLRSTPPAEPGVGRPSTRFDRRRFQHEVRVERSPLLLGQKKKRPNGQKII